MTLDPARRRACARRGLRVGRHGGPDAGRARAPGIAAVAARAGRRGRAQGASAAEDRGVRRALVRRAAQRALPRGRGERRVRRDPHVSPRLRASRSRFAMGRRASCIACGSLWRPAHLRCTAGRGAVGACSTASSTTTSRTLAGLDNDISEAQKTGLQLDPREDATAPRIYFLRREVAEFYRAVHPPLAPLESALENDGASAPAARVPARRGRSRAPHPGRGGRAARPASGRARRQRRARDEAPERHRAHHLRVGRDHRRADLDRERLRHELRAHAGAGAGASATPARLR